MLEMLELFPGAAGLKRDESDVKRLAGFLKSHNVFGRDKMNLINIINGDMATEEITDDLLGAREPGLRSIMDFIQHRLTMEGSKSFYDTPRLSYLQDYGYHRDIKL